MREAVPANLPKGGIPIPQADEVLLALVEEAERQRARIRRMWRMVQISIAFVAAAFTIVYVITKVTVIHAAQMNDAAATAWAGAVCQCKRAKREREAFCWICWNALEDCPARSKLPARCEYHRCLFGLLQILKRKAAAK